MILNRCERSERKIIENIFGLEVAFPDNEKVNPNVSEYIMDLGVNWVRYEFLWGYIENKENRYRWDRTDKFVKEMHDKKINIAGDINRIPKRLLDKNNWDKILINYERFLTDLIDRYKPGGTLAKEEGWTDNYGVEYWEIFNEPNLARNGWLRKGISPREHVKDYASALTISNYVIRKHDPDAVIILGGLSSEKSFSAAEYTELLYKENIKNCYDIYAFHPYGWDNKFDIAKNSIKIFLTELGDSDRIIWFNEYGTDDDSLRSDKLKNVFKKKNKVDGFFWLNLVDLSKHNRKKWGLLTIDYKKKSDYFLFKDLNN